MSTILAVCATSPMSPVLWLCIGLVMGAIVMFIFTASRNEDS